MAKARKPLIERSGPRVQLKKREPGEGRARLIAANFRLTDAPQAKNGKHFAKLVADAQGLLNRDLNCWANRRSEIEDHPPWLAHVISSIIRGVDRQAGA